MDSSPIPTCSPLQLTIRFTTSIPDLPLDIPSPLSTTTLALKRRIRTLLPPDAAKRHLRLIHAGKVLADTSALSSLLKPSLPRAQTPSGDGSPDSSAKGKAPMRELAPSPPTQVYIHCSIGEVLSAEALAVEADALNPPPEPSSLPLPPNNTTPAPTGFDRLLTAGFSAAEIASLRAQFLALQAHAHTPDTMPSAAEMRVLEDRWIDESAGGPGGEGGAGGFGDVGGGGANSYEDMLVGNVLGFFWPLGALVWLLREEGIWNGRRQMAVFTGIMVNVAFSVLRVTS